MVAVAVAVAAVVVTLRVKGLRYTEPGAMTAATDRSRGIPIPKLLPSG